MLATPSFADAAEATQEKLRQTITPDCTIHIHNTLDDTLVDAILKVDAYKFRQELRYRREEIVEHSNNPGFILITAESGGKPLGIVYGYDEAEGGFFLDTLASMVEGRGIGHTLATLFIIHAENTDHRHVTLYTEEQDEQGRQLRRFYQKMGFAYLGTYPEKGDVMKLQLSPETAAELYSRYISATPAAPMPIPMPVPQA